MKFLEKNVDTQKILKEANDLLRTKHKIDRTIVQVEYYQESMKECSKCKLPK